MGPAGNQIEPHDEEHLSSEEDELGEVSVLEIHKDDILPGVLERIAKQLRYSSVEECVAAHGWGKVPVALVTVSFCP